MGARMPIWNGWMLGQDARMLGLDARMRGWNVRMQRWDAKIPGWDAVWILVYQGGIFGCWGEMLSCWSGI